LHVVVDGELHPLAFGRPLFLQDAHFAPHAVDDHHAGAVGTLQGRVIDLLDPRLTGDVTALDLRVGRHLRVADLAHIAEEVCGERFRVLASGHLFDSHVGQLEVEPPGGDRRHLRQRRILDDDDRPVGWLTAMSLDDVLHLLQLEPRHAREEPGRLIEIF
jgi:hypothetical protein